MLRSLLFIMIFSSYPTANAESVTNKCTDGKQITYANLPCEKLGLKPAGPIKDGVTVVPAAPKPKKIPTENSSTDSDHSDNHGDNQGADPGEDHGKE